MRQQAVEFAKQRVGAAAAHGDRAHHRHTEFARQALDVDLDAAAARDVHHVERQYHRAADMLQFQRQPERQPEIGGVADANHQVGRRFVLDLTQHGVAGDLLVGRARAQGIGAGQVEDLDRPAGRRGEAADFLFDRDAGVVGDLLATAGQGIEQSRLAAIGIADQRHDGGKFDTGVHDVPSSATTRTAMASRRRSAMVVSATLTAIGSPPNSP